MHKLGLCCFNKFSRYKFYTNFISKANTALSTPSTWDTPEEFLKLGHITRYYCIENNSNDNVCCRKGEAPCGAQIVGHRDNMTNSTPMLNASIIYAPHEAAYTITQTVIISIIAIFLSFITVVGNVMVMVSFKIDKQLQTISNYFLCSLAVADLAIGLISMPLFVISTLLGYWPLGPLICDTWLALDYLASNASVLNLLIISFDRYFSVTRPLTYRVNRTTNKAAFMIG